MNTKVLNSKLHGAIDYVVVLFLWLSPSLFGLNPTISLLTYILGGVHLSLTALTNYHYGIFKVVPLVWHGRIELIVALALMASPLVLIKADQPFIDDYFMAVFGVTVLITWAISDYSK